MKLGLPAKKDDRPYTYGDYRTWSHDERRELIDGVAFGMSSAPSMPHQAISMELGHAIRAFLGRSGCRIFAAPFDVLLPAAPDQPEDEVATVVQPDLAVVCDPARLRSFGCFGAPDWIIEILSPDTSRRDMIAKLGLYLRGADGRYPEPTLFVGKAVARSTVCEGLEIGLEELFAAIPA